MSKQPCPYKSLPASAYWRRSVAGIGPQDLDPIVSTKFAITRSDHVATAGSCFAQHIARYLAESDFNYYVVERGHALLSASVKRAYNYGTFSCRYGNVYTTRQLLQLLQRAEGSFTPAEPVWRDGDRWTDPFRPYIQPRGFATLSELEADRSAHLQAVRHMAKTMDVFVFTLGLTESWRSREDGAVFPVCPGCGAGEFDAARYEFINLTIEDVVNDLRDALTLLRQFNSKLRVLLTVSPVSLIATYSSSHVLPATTYSKSVLRVAAEMVARDDPLTDYFPSYEIITGAHSRGAYYADDLREVREEGVSHVMRAFFRHYVGDEMGVGAHAGTTGCAATVAAQPVKAISPTNLSTAAWAAKVVCDEEGLDAE